ncbi:TPA: exo-alpha-sialidase [Candidatus Poribacteria bacterium]|nr:exo-alpha-sialidase [Candidatus Poribacteria bacterium]
MQHVTIYRKVGRYAGWPANYGIWSWGDEIVVGFTLGYHKADAGFHSRDTEKPFIGMQARSLNGGQTWQLQETPCRTPGDRGLSADEHMKRDLGVGQALETENVSLDCPGGIDFTHPDFALMCARSGLRAGAKSWFYISYDRCKKWEGPFKIPMFGQPGIAARTDYLVSSADECTLFLTAAKTNGDEGRVFCARTTDGGKTLAFLAWIGPEPEGFAIMPASVRLSESRILVAIRCREGGDSLKTRRNWIDLYASNDNGAAWDYMNRPVANSGIGGNPPTMTRLQDGRLCLTYGYRDAPYSIRAKISPDDGETWGEEIILRDDGGNHDIGYPRTVQRSDGKMVTVYYFNDQPETERYIAATIWQP